MGDLCSVYTRKRKWTSVETSRTSCIPNAKTDIKGSSSSPGGKEDEKKYEVFLSFRGSDSLFTIVDMLYNTLICAGVHVFMDDEELRVCTEIEGNLLRAITDSKIYIPIFSKNYASGKRCLREIACIVECNRKLIDDKVILPIFYAVDPTEVSLTKCLYRRALRKLSGAKSGGNDVRVQWEQALAEAASFMGLSLEDQGISKVVDLVKEVVFGILNSSEAFPVLPYHFVEFGGLKYEIMPFLRQNSCHFKDVVTYLIGKITLGETIPGDSGETTHADSAFKKNSSHFEDQPGTSGAQMTASALPSKHDDWVYDVFLNFRGVDTRDTVVSVHSNALRRAEIHVFYDDEEIRKSELIGEKLKSAIATSKFYITIFSERYASSDWCLREIAQMVQCKRESKDSDEKVILPVLCGVKVEDVKLKTDLYCKDLGKHEEEFGKEVTEQWKNALREVTQFKVFKLEDHGLYELTELIVDVVREKLWRSKESVPDDLVGIHHPMKNIFDLLDLDTSDVEFIVIYGMGGIGKTTLANIIFNRISSRYKGCCIFLSDIRESGHTNDGIVKLQEKLLCKILNLRSFNIHDPSDGAKKIKQRLMRKKVLIVLDNLSCSDQLEKLAGAPSWFGKGSRIIITTRDVDYLVDNVETPKNDNAPFIVRRENFKFYKVQVLQSLDALKLFSRLVFQSDSPPSDYYDISTEVVATTGELPLAIKVIGSSLRGKGKETWKVKLEKLKKVVHKDIREKLVVSYNDLDHSQQQIFLDIACFFINKEKTYATYYWDAQGLFPKDGINTLQNMSLIEIIDGDKLWMHDLLRDLGRNIVDENQSILGRHSRLWLPEKAFDVVCASKGSEYVVAIKLGRLPESCNFTKEQFVKLKNLKFLELDGGNFANEEFDGVFSELKWLSWDNCPEFQATNLCFKILVVLKLSESQINDNWRGWGEIKVAKKLEVLSCTYCRCLTKTPDFSAFLELKRLILKNCLSLERIDPSIGELKHLDYLEITNPILYTAKLPNEVSLWKLKEGQPQILPYSIGGLKSLSVLKLKFVNLSVLPASIGGLVNLKYLCLWCPDLVKLPSSVGNLKLLRELDISFTAVTQLPEFVINLENLEVLRYENSRIREVPDSARRLVPPKELDTETTEPSKILRILTNM